MTTDQPLLGWHFLPGDGYTRFEPRIKVEVGQTLTVDPPLKICRRGLHASVRAIDALWYAPGPVVCRVELSGEILYDSDKVCAQHRKVLWMADATQVLYSFACDEAEQALQSLGITESRCVAAIETKRRWVDGKATNEELDAASAAVTDAYRTGAVSWTVGWTIGLFTSYLDAHLSASSAARTIIEDIDSPAVNARLTAVLTQLQPGETS